MAKKKSWLESLKSSDPEPELMEPPAYVPSLPKQVVRQLGAPVVPKADAEGLCDTCGQMSDCCKGAHQLATLHTVVMLNGVLYKPGQPIWLPENAWHAWHGAAQ